MTRQEEIESLAAELDRVASRVDALWRTDAGMALGAREVLSEQVVGLGVVSERLRAVSARTRDYSDNDVVRRWASERVAMVHGSQERASVLHADYTAWCRRESLLPANVTVWGRILTDMGWTKSRNGRGWSYHSRKLTKDA